jgi:di/tricarboxylate transporter
MNLDLLIVLVLLAAAVAMFAINRPRMDAVALLMIVILPLTGIVSIGETIAGFSDSNVVLIAALFVLGEGLVRTGVAQRLGDMLIARAGNSENRLLMLLMAAVGSLGAFMSSTGVVAIFIPIVLRIAQNTGIAPSRLMMPLSVAALASGTLTLVATAPNLVVNAELVRHGSAGFSFFSFTPFGLPLMVLAIAYMLVARRLLPARADGQPAASAQPQRLADWVVRYGLAGRGLRLRITPRSPLVGRTLEQLRPRETTGADILAIERGSRFKRGIVRPTAHTRLLADDVMFVHLFTPQPDAEAVKTRLGLREIPLAGGYLTDHWQEIGMAELLVPPESRLAGSTVARLRLRDRFGLTVIGLRHGKRTAGDDMLTTTLRSGDTLLVVGTWNDILRLRAEQRDIVILNLPAEFGAVLAAPNRWIQAVASLALVVVLMVSGLVANVHAALIGCLLMGALGCVDFASAYRSIHWQSLVLIVGMLPFSTALERTGGVDLAADGLLAVIGGSGIHGVMAALFLITALLGLFISNTATAVLMAPVALTIAKDMGASPYPFAMIVALAASAAFMTPVSSPVNTLVVGPGNYGFGDFVKVGVPLTLAVMVVSVLLVPLVLPP